MALITIAEAGRLTGKGRPAIYTAINAAPPNNLSVVIDNGKKMLDPAEVQRVFGHKINPHAFGANQTYHLFNFFL